MISVIYGTKGTGKTRRIMDAANSAAESATGSVIFISDNAQSLGLNPGIKFINLAEYGVKCEHELVGFLKGILSTNFDIQKVYIDGLSRLVADPEKLKPIFDMMASKVSGDVDYVVTISVGTLPQYLVKYAI